MSSVNKSFELRLNGEERMILRDAMKIIEEISQDCLDADLFLDVDGVFNNLYSNYRTNDNELSVIVYMEE